MPKELLRPEEVVNPVLHRFYASVNNKGLCTLTLTVPEELLWPEEVVSPVLHRFYVSITPKVSVL